MAAGSNTILTDSACPVRPPLTVSYCAVDFSPPAYPAHTFFTPRTCSKTPCTPQKQPAASTAVCAGPAALGLSITGGAMMTGASAPNSGECHKPKNNAAAPSSAASGSGIANFLNDMTTFLPLRARYEVQRNRIHAITQACRPRPVVEHMAQVSIAAAAGDRIALHPKGAVAGLDDIHGRYRLPEAGPAGSGIEFGLRVI